MIVATRFSMVVATVLGIGLLAGPGKARDARRENALEYLLQGEYGLAVADSGNRVVVRWITQVADSGYVQASAAGQVVFEARTPAGQSHIAVFRRPRQRLLTLVYGSRDVAVRDTTVISLENPVRPRSKITGVDSVYVIGDVHGKAASLAELLTASGVLDEHLHWKAGRAHVVFAGDMVDRGEDATRVLWLLYRLDREAQAVGGAIDVVLGNHEIMEWVGDRRYLAPKESLFAALHKSCYACLYDPRTSILGRWLASKPGILQVNDAIYVHGGVTPQFAEMGLAGFNDALYRYIREPSFASLLNETLSVQKHGRDHWLRRYGFFFAPESPFWFRGYVQADSLGAQLDSVLAIYGATTQVVGHTPVTEIVPRYGGRLVPVNVADFATQMVLFTYAGGVRQESRRLGVRMAPLSW